MHDGVLEGTEVADFADSLIFDERSGMCFAYDPRDMTKRRLQVTKFDCLSLNCFDCAFTGGLCMWDPNFGECQLPPSGSNIYGLR